CVRHIPGTTDFDYW
nr:immunoglobulin heavy chain junction region [Macaca mulatta]MOX94906.1 immunoglobulin heavy chain junction region [Macaca mulatta]